MSLTKLVANPEVLALLSLVPFSKPTGEPPLLLNPTFGETSFQGDGADADAIAGDLVIDARTVRDQCIRTKHIHQVLGHAVLLHAPIPRCLPIVDATEAKFRRIWRGAEFHAGPPHDFWAVTVTR